MLYNIFLSLIIYTNFLIFFAKCEGEISKNQVDLLVYSYNTDILKKFEEIEQIKVNGTVSKYNILFNFKRYTMNLDKKMIENYKLLTEGQTVDILFHEEKNKIVGVKLPETIEVELKEVDPSTKGNTVTQATKKARTENGFEIIVPLFIEAGDVIKINTTTGEYKERVKKK